MKAKENYFKAAKICAKYVNLSTAVKNCNRNSELIAIVQKIFNRAKNSLKLQLNNFVMN